MPHINNQVISQWKNYDQEIKEKKDLTKQKVESLWRQKELHILQTKE